MNLTDIKRDIFGWFTTHEMFSIDDNFDELYVLTAKKDKPFQKALVEKALEEFENQLAVKIEHDEGKKTWVLEKPLDQYSQPIELSCVTVSTMSKMINDYCEQLGEPESKMNPLAASEKDVQTLCVIIHKLLEEGVEK